MTTLNLENIDLGGFGATDVKPEGEGTGFIGEQYSLDSHASSTMGEALKTDADQFSKNKQLSRDSGMPTSAVVTDPAAVETDLKLKNIDFSEMSRRTPNTSLFLTDFDNAVIAQDDINAMQHVEDTLRSIPGGLVTGFGMAIEGTGRAAEATNRIATRALFSATPEALEPYLFQQPETPDVLKVLNDFSNLITPAALTRSAGAGLKVSGEDIADVPAERQNIATDIAGGLGQVGGQIAATIINPSIALGMMFGQGVDQQGERQEASGTEGQDNVSDFALLAGGGITAVTERTGIDALMNRIPPTIKNRILRQVADISIAGGIEAVQEVVEGIAQGFLEQLTTNPDAEIFEGLDREAIAAGGTGAIVRGIINAITPGKVRSVNESDDHAITQGQIEQTTLDQLNTQIGGMKMQQRDAETLRAFVEKVDDQDTHIFVDALQTSLFLQDKTPEQIAADPALQLMKVGVEEASITGTDVTIPLTDFATDLAGSTTFDELRDHMTMSPESVTPFRAEAAQEQTANYVQELMAEAEQNVSQYVEAQEIFDTVRQQLVDTGQVTPQNASVMAQVVPAWATVYAKTNGISVQEAYTKSGLSIEGPQTGERARLEGELEILKQSLPDRFGVIDAVKGRTPIEDVIKSASELVGTVEGIYNSNDVSVFSEDNQTAINSIENVSIIHSSRPDKMATVWDESGKVYRVINGKVSEVSTEQDPNSDLTPSQGITTNILSKLFRDARNADPVEIESQRVRNLRTTETRRRQERLKTIPEMPADFDQALQQLADWSENLEEFKKALNPDMFDISDRNLTRLGRATMSLTDEFETAGTEGEVTIFRALPEGEEIEAGDWVSFDEQYASGHETNVGEEGGTTVSVEVAADEVYHPGADENEWVYIPNDTWSDITSVDELWQSLTDGSKPDTYPEVEGGQLFAQPAFHGTPHKFDEFSLDAIGTGEGAQAFGWGLYFAGKKSVAEFYRDTISAGTRDQQIASKLGMPQTYETVLFSNFLLDNNEDINDSIVEMEDYATTARENGDNDSYNNITGMIELIREKFPEGGVLDLTENKGNLFKVDIPEDSELLNYNEPLDSQGKFTTALRDITDTIHGEGTFESYVENNDGGDFRDWRDNLMEDTSDQEISELMDKRGIKGLRYLDADSRIPSADGSTQNYVIWDDSVVTVESVNDELREAEVFDQSSQTKTANELQTELTSEFDGVKISLTGSGNRATVNKIIIPEDQRGSGVGTDIMTRITDWADSNGIQLALTPSADFGGTKSRLNKFYKRFGFVDNKGKNKDFEVSETMVREAEAPLQQTDEGDKGTRGYYDPANSMIRLTESADLSTFLHEFAHFMYEMELNTDSDTSTSINNWFKRNASAVALEAGTYEPNTTIIPRHVVEFLDNGTTGGPRS